MGDDTSNIGAWVRSSRFDILLREERERIDVASSETGSVAREVAFGVPHPKFR
jgi:hypothetical protein